MKSKKTKIIILALVIIISGIIWIYKKNFSGAWPAILRGKDITQMIPPSGTSTISNTTGIPLKLPPGFSISIFAKNLPGARVIAFDGQGNMWVSQTEKGKITKITPTGVSSTYLGDLNNPHGLVFDKDGKTLFFAEERKLSKIDVTKSDKPTKIMDFPAGGRHFTRTVGFGPDDRLYISLGSSCDVCHEPDAFHATIYSVKKDGTDLKKVAQGLRNSVFFTWSYVDGKMWATEMGRDYLGDNLPPDEINIIPYKSSSVPDFGWPICYGQNINDLEFDKNVYIQDPCKGKIPPKIELPAHSAPLGLAFVPEEGWPEEYWYNLLVALHGSWNRTVPDGYKIVRIKLDSRGNYLGTEDFISGWLSADKKSALGRPVDIVTAPGGTMYVSDDKAGVIYKVQYLNK